MTGTILLIILATGVGIYHDVNKPTEYELNMEDGTNELVVLQKNNQSGGNKIIIHLPLTLTLLYIEQCPTMRMIHGQVYF